MRLRGQLAGRHVQRRVVQRCKLRGRELVVVRARRRGRRWLRRRHFSVRRHLLLLGWDHADRCMWLASDVRSALRRRVQRDQTGLFTWAASQVQRSHDGGRPGTSHVRRADRRTCKRRDLPPDPRRSRGRSRRLRSGSVLLARIGRADRIPLSSVLRLQHAMPERRGLRAGGAFRPPVGHLGLPSGLRCLREQLGVSDRAILQDRVLRHARLLQRGGFGRSGRGVSLVGGVCWDHVLRCGRVLRRAM